MRSQGEHQACVFAALGQRLKYDRRREVVESKSAIGFGDAEPRETELTAELPLLPAKFMRPIATQHIRIELAFCKAQDMAL